MQCPHCSAENPVETRYCTACGQPLEASATTLPPLQDAPPYKPSGKCPQNGLIMLLIAAVVGSLVVGVAYHLVTRMVNLLILFPLGVGYLIGMAMTYVIVKGKRRNTALVVALALTSCTLAFGTRFFCESLQMRGMFIQSLAEESVGKSSTQLPQVKAEMAKEISPFRFFPAYLSLRAQAGISIGRSFSSSSTDMKGAGFFWGLLVLELALACWVAVKAAHGAVTSPYCEQCQSWMSDTTIMRVHPSGSAALLEKLRTQDWDGAANSPVGGSLDDKNHCDVNLSRCADCRDTFITLVSTTNGKTKRLLNAHLAPESVVRLLRALQPESVPTDAPAATEAENTPAVEA